MKILAHPLRSGGYITYLLDDTGRPLVAEMKDTQQEIVDASVALAKKYNTWKIIAPLPENQNGK